MNLHVRRDVKLLWKICIMLLVVQASCMAVAGQDWQDYDDDASDMWQAKAPGPMPGHMHQPFGGGYGAWNKGWYGPMPYGPVPYGTSPPPSSPPPPPPPHSPPPPPPPPATVVVTEGYSTSTTVPAIKSTATLTNYATVAAFNSTERTRFVEALEANILKLLDVLANVTIDSVVASSVSVDDTIAFTGSDSTAAAAARDSLVTALSSGDTSIFGTTFGTVTVSSVSSTNATNTATKSGAGPSYGWTFLVISAASVFVTLYFTLDTAATCVATA